MRAHELSLAVSPAAGWAAWHGGTGTESAIYFQPLGADGALEGQALRLSSEGKTFAYEPDLILARGSPVAAWCPSSEHLAQLAA